MDTNNPEKPSSTPTDSQASATKIDPQTERLHIDAPNAGSVQVVDVQNAKEIAFNFDLANVRVSAIDVDLVIMFPDNSKLILPGLAMDLLGLNAPKLRSLNKQIQSQEIIASISQINLAETTPSVHLASTDFMPKKQGGNAANDKSSADGSENAEVSPAAAAAPVITPVRPSVVIEPVKSSSANGAKVETVEAGSIASSKLNAASVAGEPPVTKNPPPTSSSQSSSAAKGNAPFSIQAADVTIKALALTGGSETEQSNGKIIVGSGGATIAATDASFAAQSAKESLAGGSGNDIIYADSPSFSSSGSASRLLDVSVTMPTSNILASRVTISGLPIGFSILNAENVGGNWVLPVGSIKPNNFQIQLVYKIPDDAEKPDANGFYKRFNISMTFDGTNGTGGKGSISATTSLGIRDVNSEGDQNFIDPVSGKPVVVLYRQPAGNVIDAGTGDDTIYAAAGADIIDGGDGNNRVNYGNSQSGVSVNLTTGKGQGGFATGDSLAHIQAVDGSAYADTLIGNTENNTFAGGAGADSLQGGDGSDFVDYSTSSASVTVNLLTGEGIGGDAQGDSLQGFEGAIGSIYADLLTANATGSTLFGGKGNDTLISGAGADSLIGDEGDNTVDYRNSIGGITIDLKNKSASGGDAEGDQFLNIENVTGSSHNDSILGDSYANLLDGGAGDDCLIGTGGSDIMRGGANNDYMLIDQTFLGGGGSIDGGSGNDTLSFAANSGNLTLTNANFDNIVTNVEVLDFTSVGTNVTMSLNATDISSITGQALTAGSTAKLDIFQNAGDSISMSAQAGYTFDTSTANGVTTYTIYNNTDPHDPAHQLAQLIVH